MRSKQDMIRRGPCLAWRLNFWLAVIMPAVIVPASFASGICEITPGFERVNLTTFTDYLPDPAFNLHLEEIQHPSHAVEFKPVETKTISLGVVDAQCWYRFTLRNTLTIPQTFLVEIDNPRLQDITFYVPNVDGTFLHQNSGAFVARNEASTLMGNAVFPVLLESKKEVTCYLRARHRGSFRFGLNLWMPKVYVEYRVVTLIFQALLYGMLFVLILYSILLFSATRESGYFYNALFAGSLLFLEVALRGFGAQYFWPDHPIWADRSILVSEGIVIFCAAAFTRVLLQTRQTCLWLDRLFFVTVLGGGVLAVVGLTDWMWTNWLAHILGSITPALMLATGCWYWYRKHPGAKFYVLAWSAGSAGAIVYMLMSMALLPLTVWTEHSVDIGIALGPVFFSLALADRFRNLEKRHQLELEGKVIERTAELRQALDNVKTLRGLIPICCNCKKIRDDKGYWEQIDVYMKDYMEGDFSHGICPACAQKLYGKVFTNPVSQGEPSDKQ